MFVGGDYILWGSQRGEPVFFSGSRGDQNSFAHGKGGCQKNLPTSDLKQPVPLPEKNDSSLMVRDRFVSKKVVFTKNIKD